MRDFKRLRQDPPQGVNGSPNPDNIMLWNAVIFGPEDTPWDGGTLGGSRLVNRINGPGLPAAGPADAGLLQSVHVALAAGVQW